MRYIQSHDVIVSITRRLAMLAEAGNKETMVLKKRTPHQDCTLGHAHL
ncbi:hypothetical protein [Staphylococcus microti]|nr:hypothetical protein [Staphylococcus microti]